MSSFLCSGEDTTDDEATYEAKYKENLVLLSFETSFDSDNEGRTAEQEEELGSDVIERRALKQAKFLSSTERNDLSNYKVFSHRERRQVLILGI